MTVPFRPTNLHTAYYRHAPVPLHMIAQKYYVFQGGNGGRRLWSTATYGVALPRPSRLDLGGQGQRPTGSRTARRSVAGTHQILAVPMSPRAGLAEPEDACPESADRVRSLYAPTCFREAETGGFWCRIHPNGALACDTRTRVGGASRRMPRFRYAEGQALARRPGPLQVEQATASSEPADCKTGSSVSSRVRRWPGAEDGGRYGIQALGICLRIDLSGPAVGLHFGWLHRNCRGRHPSCSGHLPASSKAKDPAVAGSRAGLSMPG